jgi:hypothetical protein
MVTTMVMTIAIIIVTTILLSPVLDVRRDRRDRSTTLGPGYNAAHTWESRRIAVS